MEEPKRRDGKGRPRKLSEHKKGKKITISLTDKVYASLLEKCKISKHKTLSEYARAVVINGHVRAALTDDEKKLLHTFIGLANNVNQLAFQANLGGVKSIEKELSDFIPVLRNKVNELKK